MKKKLQFSEENSLKTSPKIAKLCKDMETNKGNLGAKLQSDYSPLHIIPPSKTFFWIMQNSPTHEKRPKMRL
jgi:hypothetical protein